jgi:hypothetical protein
MSLKVVLEGKSGRRMKRWAPILTRRGTRIGVLDLTSPRVLSVC